MQTLTLTSGTTISVHDSPHTLPEARRVDHEYYSLIESGIGSSQDDFDRHFNVMIGLVGSEDTEAQFNAINNVRFLFSNLLGKQYSARSLAFCCLIDSVDNQKWTDFSETGVERLLHLLSEKGLTNEFLTAHLGALKKNFLQS